MVEERKEHWLKFLAIIIATFIGAFLAFYFAVDLTLTRLTDPGYQVKKMEKMLKQSEKNFKHFEDNFAENPFEPRMSPMLVNLVKEPAEYKLIVDLKPLFCSEKNIKVSVEDNVVTVSGAMEKVEHHRENIVNFSQTYHLDEKLDVEGMTKEKKGCKYIITIPYKD